MESQHETRCVMKWSGFILLIYVAEILFLPCIILIKVHAIVTVVSGGFAADMNSYDKITPGLCCKSTFRVQNRRLVGRVGSYIPNGMNWIQYNIQEIYQTASNGGIFSPYSFSQPMEYAWWRPQGRLSSWLPDISQMKVISICSFSALNS